MSRRAQSRRIGRELLQGRVVVLSPHPDDAVLSLGATLARAAALGAIVSVVTVFAGDPKSARPAGDWDRRAGFLTAGEAARRRREEDFHACRVVGAEPLWLSFLDSQYGAAVEEAGLQTELARYVARAETLVVPGFPLVQSDHLLLARAALGVAPARARIVLYAEQPYAAWRWRAGRPRDPVSIAPSPEAVEPVTWLSLRPSVSEWWKKQRAVLSYSSQLRAFSRVPFRLSLLIALDEFRAGGEGLGVVHDPPAVLELFAGLREGVA